MEIKTKHFIAGIFFGFNIALAIWGINNIISYYSKSDQSKASINTSESTKKAYINYFKGFSTSGSQCVGLGPESKALLETRLNN